MSTVGLTASAPVPAPKPAARLDFPSWLPPMLVKELRQGLRTRGFVGAFIVFQSIMAIMMIFVVSDASASANAAARANNGARIESIFWAIMAVQLLIVTPARALGSLQMEIESRTLDLLVLTRLNAWRIVAGKWTSLLAQSVLLLIAMLPYGIVRYFGGSVDLVRDAGACCSLLVGCAVLTAAGLWASGMPKIVRVVLPIALVVMFSNVTGFMRAGLFAGVGGPSLGGTQVLLFFYFNALVVTVFFMVAAVRRIAPPAESHVLLARAAPLAILLPVPLSALFGSRDAAIGQLIFGGLFLGLVCAIELSNVGRPMVAHWRPWRDRGPFFRVVGRLFLPGWQSALWYVLVVAALVIPLTLLPRVVTDPSKLIWMTVLGLGALVCPVLALPLVERRSPRSVKGIYVLVFGALSTFAAIAAGLGSMFGLKYSALLTFAKVLPVSGFWLSLGGDLQTDVVIYWQGLLVVAVLATAFYFSRLYWREIALYDVRDRLKTK